MQPNQTLSLFQKRICESGKVKNSKKKKQRERESVGGIDREESLLMLTTKRELQKDATTSHYVHFFPPAQRALNGNVVKEMHTDVGKWRVAAKEPLNTDGQQDET